CTGVLSMLATKITCPHCQVAMKTTKAVPVGSTIRCLKCRQPFTVAPEKATAGDTVPEAVQGKVPTAPDLPPDPTFVPVPAKLAGLGASVRQPGAAAAAPGPVLVSRPYRPPHRGPLRVLVALALVLLLVGGVALFFLSRGRQHTAPGPVAKAKDQALPELP